MRTSGRATMKSITLSTRGAGPAWKNAYKVCRRRRRPRRPRRNSNWSRDQRCRRARVSPCRTCAHARLCRAPARWVSGRAQELAFEYLDPGKYKLKAIVDLDANSVWSPGNFNKWLQPEKIVFYKGTLEVRANWDIDLDEPWKIEN